MQLSDKKGFELIKGDVSATIPTYIAKHPGFRISYLYFDLDVEKPTAAALKLLYDRVVCGGIIVFDEYGVDQWGEANAVDAFLEEHPELSLRTLPWAKTPPAYIVKP